MKSMPNNYISNRMLVIETFINESTREEIIDELIMNYNYDPIKSILTINGIRVIVMFDEEKETQMTLAREVPILRLGEEYFNVKSKDSRKFILYHEIAHARLHQININSKTQNWNIPSDKQFIVNLNGILKYIKEQSKFSLEEKENIIKTMMEWKETYISRYSVLSNSEKVLLRNKLRQTYKKILYDYPFIRTAHEIEMIVNEFESDLYAVQFSSKENAKKALNEVYGYYEEKYRRTHDTEDKNKLKEILNISNLQDKYKLFEIKRIVDIRQRALELNIDKTLSKNIIN